MATSPLQLSYSIFDQVHVEALNDYEWDDVELEPDVDVRVSRSSDDEDEWAVWLTIVIPRNAEPTPPYAVTLGAFGTFDVGHDFDSEDEIAHVLAVNGASMLYSAAREFLLIITGRGPNMEYLLPTLDFRKHPYSVLEPDRVEQGRATEPTEVAEAE